MRRGPFVLALVVSLAFIFVGCSGENGTVTGDAAAIENAVKGFYSAYNAKNRNTCLSYVDDTNDVGASTIQAMLQLARAATGAVTVKSVTTISVTGSTATADLRITYADQSETEEYPLVKKGGSWKIAWQ